MIILHENSLEEAVFVQKRMGEFGVACEIRAIDLSNMYRSSDKFPGFVRKSREDHVKILGEKTVIVITSRDVHASDNDDSWVFGYCMMDLTKRPDEAQTPLFVVCTFRMKDQSLHADSRLNAAYFECVFGVAIHEIAHVAVTEQSLKPAYWVGKNGFVQELGLHCVDRRCMLYQSVDLHDPTDGVLRIGEIDTTDAGLLSLIARRYPSYFCPTCLPQVKNYLSAIG